MSTGLQRMTCPGQRRRDRRASGCRSDHGLSGLGSDHLAADQRHGVLGGHGKRGLRWEGGAVTPAISSRSEVESGPTRGPDDEAIEVQRGTDHRHPAVSKEAGAKTADMCRRQRDERAAGVPGSRVRGRTTIHYRSSRDDGVLARAHAGRFAGERRRFGYRRLHILLRQEGVVINRKRTQRVYRETRARRPTATGDGRSSRPQRRMPRWSLDFVQRPTRGRAAACAGSTSIDDATKRCLAAVVDTLDLRPARSCASSKLSSLGTAGRISWSATTAT